MFPLNYILFLQILIFLFITPGTPRIVIISHSMNYGVKKCIWTALGDVSANIIQGTLVIFVIGSFFLDNPNFLNILKWAGIAYLFYLAYDVYKTKPKDPNSKNITEKRHNSISDGWTPTRFGAHRVFMTVTLCYKKSIRLQQNLVFFRITNAGWACQNLRFNQSVLSRRISTMPLFEGAGGECIANRNSNPL